MNRISYHHTQMTTLPCVIYGGVSSTLIFGEIASFLAVFRDVVWKARIPHKKKELVLLILVRIRTGMYITFLHISLHMHVIYIHVYETEKEEKMRHGNRQQTNNRQQTKEVTESACNWI